MKLPVLAFNNHNMMVLENLLRCYNLKVKHHVQKLMGSLADYMGSNFYLDAQPNDEKSAF